jgi:hypothetical protein
MNILACAAKPITLIWYNGVLQNAGNTKGESITVPLTSCLTGLESAV